jgi:hypothetical protein
VVGVRRVKWDIVTSALEGSGTDAHVRVEIWRDDERLADAVVEPGGSPALDTGTAQRFGWTFRPPAGRAPELGPDGSPTPHTEPFPHGVRGHLAFTFRIYGTDLWRFERIDVTVITGAWALGPTGWMWVESEEVFPFAAPNGVALSTDGDQAAHHAVTLRV